jgi:hypothetical protein
MSKCCNTRLDPALPLGEINAEALGISSTIFEELGSQ